MNKKTVATAFGRRAARATAGIAGAAVVALSLAFAGPASAGAAGDRLFVTGVFDNMPAQTALIYSHSRQGDDTEGKLFPIKEGEISLTMQDGSDGAREAVVRMTADGRSRELTPFPASAGNPLLMTFLESSLRTMARVTGGSPFYIRNRMKEVLREGGEMTAVTAEHDGASVPADELVFRPFANDPNRDRMGAFADLELRFVLSRETPGGFLLLSASTARDDQGAFAFREVMALREVQDGS